MRTFSRSFFPVCTVVSIALAAVALSACAEDETTEEQGTSTSLQRRRGDGNPRNNGNPGDGNPNNNDNPGDGNPRNNGKPGDGNPNNNGACDNDNRFCGYWASVGECTNNPGYMIRHCCNACRPIP
jgi:hypothetical protein